MKILILFFFIWGTSWAAEHTITMRSMSFDPKNLELKSGDTVKWVNASHSKHSAIFAKDLNLDSGDVSPNKTSREVTFSKPGNYPYHCKIHGQAMSATVEVK
jgi:plastocyanin